MEVALLLNQHVSMIIHFLLWYLVDYRDDHMMITIITMIITMIMMSSLTIDYMYPLLAWS